MRQKGDMNKGYDIVDEETAWTAVKRRDRHYDGQFITGVMTTGIYCRPSCAARHPLRKNVRFFANTNDAQAAGLRACMRCRPDEVARDEAAVRAVIDAIRKSQDKPGLAELAKLAGYSPTHLQKLFKHAIGLSPAVYARALRSERAQDALEHARNVTDAVYDAGYSGPSRFYAENGKRLGMSASAWKNGGAGVQIHWAVVKSYLGDMLIAATEKGVCRLSFGEGEDALKSRFPKAELHRGGDEFAALAEKVIAAVEHPGEERAIPLDVQGTAFQEAVWAELQKIPAGETRTYAELAAAVGRPKAHRAAGSANGANNVAVLIPCHRVIASDGSLGGYAYGLDIKRKLLEAEKS